MPVLSKITKGSTYIGMVPIQTHTTLEPSPLPNIKLNGMAEFAYYHYGCQNPLVQPNKCNLLGVPHV